MFSDTGYWSLCIIIVLCGFVLAVYLWFPLDLIEKSARNQINHRLPSFVQVVSLNIDLPFSFEVTPTVQIKSINVTLPLSGEVVPGLSPDLRLRARDTKGLTAQVSFEDRTFNARLNKFPVKAILKRQTGAFDGSIKGTFQKRLQSEFDFSGQLNNIKENPLIPSILVGQTLNRISFRGKSKNNTIQFQNVQIQSERIDANGSGEFTVKQPLSQSRLSVSLQIRKPVQTQFSKNAQLREFGLF